MKPKTMITIAAVAGGAALLYLYLQKSGLWASWFSSAANKFTDGAKLLAYCQAQNLASGVTAIFIDPAGGEHSATCADWIRAQSGSGGGQTAGLAAVEQADGSLLQELRAAAIASPVLGVDRANVDQWNLILRELDPQARTSELAETGVRRGHNDMMTAAQFLELRHRAGLTAMAPPEAAYENPMSWVN